MRRGMPGGQGSGILRSRRISRWVTVRLCAVRSEVKWIPVGISRSWPFWILVVFCRRFDFVLSPDVCNAGQPPPVTDTGPSFWSRSMGRISSALRTASGNCPPPCSDSYQRRWRRVRVRQTTGWLVVSGDVSTSTRASRNDASLPVGRCPPLF